MPAFGLDKAIAKAVARGVRAGAKKAKVKRPGQDEFLAGKKKPEPDSTVVKNEPIDPNRLEEPKPASQEPELVARATDEPPVATLDPKQPTVVKEPFPELDFDDIAEGTRLSQLRLREFALDESFQTNFDTINTTDEIKAIIADVSQQNAGRIDEARRGIITQEQLVGLAEDLNVHENVVKAIMEREVGGVVNAETILAARQVLNSSAERIHTLATKIAKGEGTDIDKLTFRRQIQWHREFQTEFMGARAESGRALNAFKIPTAADEIDITRMRELVDAVDGFDTDRIAKAISLMENTGAVTKATRKYTQSKLMGVINELFINSILSGPKTHVINTTGNILMQTMNVAETAVAARIGRFLGPGEHVQVGEASALLHGTIGAYRDAFRLMSKSAQTGTSLDDVVKFESTRRRSISAEHLLTPEQRATPLGAIAEGLLDGVRVSVIPPSARGKPFIDPVSGAVRTIPESIPLPGIGQIIRAPTERVMMPVDEFFKTLAYRSEVERRAFLHANEQVASGAAKAIDAADIAREFMENTPLKVQKAAEDFTRYVTFQNPLGTRGQAFQLALRKTPVLSLLAPFVRTPVNIFTAGILDRSPVALFRSKFWQAMKTGGRERDVMLARVSMGTATSAIVASYTMDGTITGAGPSNPDARALLELSGWLPYGIRAGDKYHSYARMEPLAFVIGATADATEILSYIESDGDSGLDDERTKINDAASAIIIGVANNTMSKTYVKGIADFTEMMSDPERYFQSWSKTMTSALVPFSALRSQLGAIDDPYLREAWTILDNIKVKSGIPGLSKEAPPRRDFFGEPRLRRSGSLLGSMSPIPDTTIVQDPIVDELITLMETTRTVPVGMPSKRIEGLRLNTEEYDKLIIIARSRSAPNGRTFKQELQRLFSNSTYVNATPDMRVELIKDIQGRYDGVARALLEQEDVLFAARIAAHRRKRNRLRFGVEE